MPPKKAPSKKSSKQQDEDAMDVSEYGEDDIRSYLADYEPPSIYEEVKRNANLSSRHPDKKLIGLQPWHQQEAQHFKSVTKSTRQHRGLVRASLYIAAHGQYANEEGSSPLISIADYVSGLYQGDRRKVQEFESFLNELNYTSASHLSFAASMDPIGVFKLKSTSELIRPPSEITNLYTLNSGLAQDFDFTQNRLNIRALCADTKDRDVQFVDIKGYIRPTKEIIKVTVNKDPRATREVCGNFWQEYKMNMNSLNKQYFLKPNKKENKDFYPCYGVHPRQVRGDDMFRIVDMVTVPSVHEQFYTLPKDAEESIARELEAYMARHHIEYTPLIQQLINKIYRHPTGSIRDMDDVTCTMGDILVLYKELGIFIDMYDASCSVILFKKGKITRQIFDTKEKPLSQAYRETFPNARASLPSYQPTQEDVYLPGYSQFDQAYLSNRPYRPDDSSSLLPGEEGFMDVGVPVKSSRGRTKKEKSPTEEIIRNKSPPKSTRGRPKKDIVTMEIDDSVKINTRRSNRNKSPNKGGYSKKNKYRQKRTKK